MQPLRIMTLDLRSPLRYLPSTCTDPFVAPGEGERVARFDLDPAIAEAIDPDPSAYLASASLVADSRPDDSTEEDQIVISTGRYLFAQLRPEGEAIDAELFASAALELQKDGLWRGIALERCVYLRSLREEGGLVFQILRPIAADRPS